MTFQIVDLFVANKLFYTAQVAPPADQIVHAVWSLGGARSVTSRHLVGLLKRPSVRVAENNPFANTCTPWHLLFSNRILSMKLVSDRSNELIYEHVLSRRVVSNHNLILTTCVLRNSFLTTCVLRNYFLTTCVLTNSFLTTHVFGN